MKKYKLSFLALALALFTFVGCDEPNSEIIFDLTFVELDAATTSNGQRVYTYLRENNGVNKPSGFKVNLASKPLNEDVQVNFEIDPASTAIANVHYVVANQVVVIPAGENIAELPIDIIADGINAGEQLSIIIRITDASVDVAEGLDVAPHLIQISCPPNIPDGVSWSGVTTLGAFGRTGTNANVSITYAGGTTYNISDPTSGFYLNFGGTQDYPGTFDNICDGITLNSTQIGEFGTVALTDAANGAPAGTWDPGSETLTIPWYDPGNDFADNSVFTRN